MDKVNLSSLGAGDVPIIAIPADEHDFISEDGRYFVNGKALLAELHAEAHAVLDVQTADTPAEQALIDSASGFFHLMLGHMLDRMDTTTLEATLARSE